MVKLMKYMKPYLGLVFAIIFFMFGQAIAELYLPTLMSDIVNNGMLNGDTRYILQYGFYMLLVALLSSVFAIVGSYLSAKAAVGFGMDLRERIFTQVEDFSLHEFDKIGASSLITRTTNDVTQIQTVLVMAFRFIIYAPILCIGGIVMAIQKDRALTIILAVVVPALILIMLGVAAAVIPMFKTLQKRLDHLNLVMRENLIGIRVIRAFNRVFYDREKFVDANKKLTDISIKVNKIMAVMMPVMMIMMNLTTVWIIWFGGIRIATNHLQIGEMLAFMQYAMQILFSFIMVSIMFVMLPRAEASAVRIYEVLEMTSEINDPKTPNKADQKRGYVEFQDVTFSYHGAESPVIKNISFSACPGETTAIIGGTGSGKSTLINLIPRFYDIDSGSILVDGEDIRNLAQKDLRSKIGFVPQSAILFSGTVNDNIKYGKIDATEEEIKSAADIAQASTFISEMTDGYHSIISQGGTNLSGGQKQRLSIARALVRRPEIYIFDDSFSALDFKTDALLRAALKKEIQDATVIIVAQRVSSIIDADRIIVLDEGKIVGIGTHKELLKTCEVYREIVSSQLSEEELA